MIIELHETPSKRHVQLAVSALQEGEVIVYPTDTLYGMGCELSNYRAIDRVYRIKKMDPKKPLSILCSSISQIAEYAKVSNHAFRLLKQLTPGPYTFLFSVQNKIPKYLMPKRKTIGIRLPDNDFIKAVLEEHGAPIINTTVTSDGDFSFSDPQEIANKYINRINYIFSEGVSYSDDSTIIDLSGIEAEIIREGKGDISML